MGLYQSTMPLILRISVQVVRQAVRQAIVISPARDVVVERYGALSDL